MSSSTTNAVTILEKRIVFPEQKSTLSDLKLSISDLNMICCHYIQKGCLFTNPSIPSHTLISLLTNSLSRALSIFPPLAGRFLTDSDGYIYITSNDAGVDFVHATATDRRIADLLSPTDVPHLFKELFPYDKKINYDAHFSPILAVQVTELADGVFIGCAVSHAVVDGTSLWNFFNTFAEVTGGATSASRLPDFRRESILVSNAVLRLPEGEIKVAFNADERKRERIFSFSYVSLQKLKALVNYRSLPENVDVEWIGKESNDTNVKPVTRNETVEISSFQSLCALMWRAVTRARNLPETKTTTFRMAVNIRHRLEPKLSAYYFGNAIQSIATRASARDVLSNDLRWCAEQLNKNVNAHDSTTVRREVEDWEREPKCFALGNKDGATMQMGSSPRFPMYDNDFGWGRPVAVRSGAANKFDGKMSAFPGREGGGSVDLEVVLAPETMAGIENDPEFLLYASG
ncbi:hypothetical protein TanjilG_21352 [Lupinus angustifolius]|uniref:Acetyltransferase n=1 Tax=Lupinus angustifolius TaxID=3871 RepID=A0A4P1RN63_LUPAN|nr:PREDICTED: uncharacterized acetyltransferase At3g50280-like [Lupinus angustifolius]OIW14212.1 hypothetical protein TanjilG_21352 [Lupinus angustifolius]